MNVHFNDIDENIKKDINNRNAHGIVEIIF